MKGQDRQSHWCPSIRCRDRSKNKWKLWPAGGVRSKVGQSPTTVLFILWGQWMCVPNFMPIHCWDISVRTKLVDQQADVAISKPTALLWLKRMDKIAAEISRLLVPWICQLPKQLEYRYPIMQLDPQPHLSIYLSLFISFSVSMGVCSVKERSAVNETDNSWLLQDSDSPSSAEFTSHKTLKSRFKAEKNKSFPSFFLCFMFSIWKHQLTQKTALVNCSL